MMPGLSARTAILPFLGVGGASGDGLQNTWINSTGKMGQKPVTFNLLSHSSVMTVCLSILTITSFLLYRNGICGTIQTPKIDFGLWINAKKTGYRFTLRRFAITNALTIVT